MIDGKADPSCLNRVCQLKNTVEDADVLSGRIEINAVWFDPHLILRIQKLHLRVLLQNSPQHALPFRVQVLEDHEGHAGVRRHVVEKTLKRFEPACGSPKSDDREGFFCSLASG